MADTNDTIDGLLAEFRGYAAGMPPSYHVTTSWHDFRRMLDRLEAAHKRERGDCAKLREAVIGLRDRISMFYKNEWIPYDEWEGANDDANSALAEPPRNCDVYTADELKAIFKSELDSQLPIANEHEKNLVTITATGVIDTLFATTQKGGNDAD